VVPFCLRPEAALRYLVAIKVFAREVVISVHGFVVGFHYFSSNCH